MLSDRLSFSSEQLPVGVTLMYVRYSIINSAYIETSVRVARTQFFEAMFPVLDIDIDFLYMLT